MSTSKLSATITKRIHRKKPGNDECESSYGTMGGKRTFLMGQGWWCTPVIAATQGVEIKRVGLKLAQAKS
jgi:hypothetical protein